MLTGIAAAVVMLAVVGVLGGFRAQPGGPVRVTPGRVVDLGLFKVQITDARAGPIKLHSFDPAKNLLLVRMRVTNVGDKSYGMSSFTDGVVAEPRPGKYVSPDFMDSAGYIDGGMTSSIHPRLPITVQLVWPLGNASPRTVTLALRQWTYGQSFTTDEFYWSVDKQAPFNAKVTLPVRQGATS